MTTEELPDAADLWAKKEDFNHKWTGIPFPPENPQENLLTCKPPQNTEVKNVGVTMNQTIKCPCRSTEDHCLLLKTQLIKSLIMPHFDYASVVYIRAVQKKINFFNKASFLPETDFDHVP